MPPSALEHAAPGSSDRERRLLVGVVDALVVASLLTIGSITHGVNPVREPLHVAGTLAPFVVGWLVVAPIAGHYADEILGNAGRAAARTTVAWLAAANVGLILRSSPVFEGGSRWPFGLVVTALGLLVLVTWRVSFARFLSPRWEEVDE